jgi:hypothetical protein
MDEEPEPDYDNRYREAVERLKSELTPEQISELEERGRLLSDSDKYNLAYDFATDNKRERFLSQYPEYMSSYATHCWREANQLYYRRNQPGFNERAQEIVIELIDSALDREIATDDAIRILDDLFDRNFDDIDVSACWELHRRKQFDEERKEIQQRYSRPLGVTSGAAQAISGRIGPPPAMWGSGFDVLWSLGEPLLVEAAYGAGKTTLAGLLIRAQIFGGDVLGFPVRKLLPGQKILYLAIDRPEQILGSMSRQFSPEQLAEIEDRLVIWRGVLPADAAEDNDLYVNLCDYHQTHFVYVDSLKDAARGLTEDRAAAAYQATRTRLLATRRQLVELHHLAKSGADYGSIFLRAGVGSALRMSGRPGGPSGVLTHDKQPAHRVGPLKIKHDRDRGEIEVAEAETPVELVGWIADQSEGVTAAETAQLLFGTAGDSEVKRAKRKLTELVDAGQLRMVASQGRNPTMWYAATGH